MPIENILCKITTNTSLKWVRPISTGSVPSTRPRGERTSGVPPPSTPTSGRHHQLGTARSVRSEPADSSLPVAEALARCLPQPPSSLQPIFLNYFLLKDNCFTEFPTTRYPLSDLGCRCYLCRTSFWVSLTNSAVIVEGNSRGAQGTYTRISSSSRPTQAAATAAQSPLLDGPTGSIGGITAHPAHISIAAAHCHWNKTLIPHSAYQIPQGLNGSSLPPSSPLPHLSHSIHSRCLDPP